jgi:hypothetical protein
MSVLRFRYRLLLSCSWWKDLLLRLSLSLVPRKHPFRSDKKNFIKNTVVMT